MTRKALGKGIKAIITDETRTTLATEARPLNVAEVRPNPYQPRQQVEEDISELTESVREKGVLQPIVVRRRRDGFELVMGERRLRAAKQAGLETIPAVVRDVEDREMLELALIENVQRTNLNPVDEALAYKRLVDEFGLTHDDVARKVGRDRSTVSNAVRLLSLPFKCRDALAARQISAGHARALLQLESRREQVDLCERIIADGLSVRAVERICGERKPGPKRVPREKDVHTREVEEALQQRLGTKVTITEPGRKPGRVIIDYFSAEDLTRLARLIRGE